MVHHKEQNTKLETQAISFNILYGRPRPVTILLEKTSGALVT
jgi:hypothetical protein